MQALCKNETWDLVPDSPHKKAIGCRWIYKVKYNVDGSVNRYKALVIAKGYAQMHGVDYEETFSLVAKMTTMRTMIATVVAKGWHSIKLTSRTPFFKAN